MLILRDKQGTSIHDRQDTYNNITGQTWMLLVLSAVSLDDLGEL